MHTLEQLRAGKLAGIQRLDLAAGLTEFPREIFDLADTLEVLNLSGNALTELPDDLGRLHKLRVLFCSDNRFTTVPAVLGQCPQLSMVGFKANQIHTLPAEALTPALRWLILTDNQLNELPDEIGNCPQLQKLMLAGNQLRELPESLSRCTLLELLRIAANQLTALPAWLLDMPRLAWLAYAGNPFCERAETAAVAQHPIGTIDWAELAIEQQLGEGASGVIYQAQWQKAGAPAANVAVKLFKGALTSDGLPHSEMAACISAGAHPNLIAVEGKVAQHPANAEGLVLELISPDFQNLAGPPSLASCTRDVYAAGTSFTQEAALRLATGIAAATSQLHANGILHGDLYAHNILTTDTGDALLGDFGAACFFSHDEPETSRSLQQLEARAFGCLLEELLERCAVAEATPEPFEALWNLQRQCVQPTVAARPVFREIHRSLLQVQKAAAQILSR
ncbi:leucine-rich repeat-containing protein kinase family protein [Hymenobacter sp. BT770]|uniref:leucine-rich repeat-containing protein kinase family protein n=1 Tax=Hymenobacter sp. BT770 TaxID=2886942 RepID=UPI001D127BB0|nr:leucine-rich repeat-containing protein kinase family protein [Hymenobacter sp. BT770]MCC3153515.1 leucine-rich repeat-containing serine/threonine-protein kinase [Hymenobacter sp. BT770]MDO3415752.1 leucine-rich repeat-containing protein kinase family protein [Hymenobacter sp. BT770]